MPDTISTDIAEVSHDLEIGGFFGGCNMRGTSRVVLLSVLVFCLVLATAAALILRLPWIRAEPVVFQSSGAVLNGTLALPRWQEGPFPAVVVVQGSANLARWPYWSFVRQLAPHGMAVLIYDKRGTGDSGGRTVQPQRWSTGLIEGCEGFLAQLADDAVAGAKALAARADIDRTRIGLAGISQAGWIMPMAAARSESISFIVSISGPAVSCGLEDRYSQLTGEYADNPQFGGPVPFAPGELTDAEIEALLDLYEGPQGYDPVPALARLTVPSLWLLGGRDRSVPTAMSAANLEQLMAAGAPIELLLYPEGNHVLARGDGNWPRIDYWPAVRQWMREQNVLAAN